MSPLIQDGDILVVEPEASPAHGDAVAATLNGTTLIRRFFRSGPLLSLLPDNPEYDAISIESDMAFRVLGVVTHVVHAL